MLVLPVDGFVLLLLPELVTVSESEPPGATGTIAATPGPEANSAVSATLEPMDIFIK
jgi:hypothetical protein